MTSQPLRKLEFTDCLGCGKRVATTAPICRHCNTKRTPAPLAISAETRQGAPRANDEPDEDAESHASLGLGGYGLDDYDEDAEVGESASKRKTLWWYVALMLLIVFAVGSLVPWF